MQSRHPNHQLEQDLAANEEEEGIDFERLKELLGFVIRAPLRRPFLAAAVFLIGGGLGIAIAITLPRTYSSQVKLLAQINLVVPALSNPDSRVPREANNPTKDLSDQILRRDNMIALAKETNLVERYYAARSPALKLKDKLLGGPATEDDKVQIVVATLEKNITVTVLDGNVVTIAVDWYDPQMAFGLVTTVQKNFQSARYDDDVAMITDAISVLQDHAKVEAAAVDAALEEYRKVVLVVPPPTPGSAVPRTPHYAAVRNTPTAASAAATAIDPDLAQALEDKRLQIRSLETQRQRDLEQLRGQLAQAQLTLTPQHPTVIALQQKVDSLTVPDPQLAQLKADERALMASLVPPLPPPPKPSSGGTTNVVREGEATEPVPAPIVSTLGTPKEDPRVQLIRAKLEGAIHRYQDAVSRIDGANMELDIARTAFKYRYTVVTPAELSRKPKKAVGPIVGITSVVAALLLAFLIAAAADLGSGRILEEWQVRRQLKLEILGEFDPKLPPGPA
jgi:hypothetical protein